MASPLPTYPASALAQTIPDAERPQHEPTSKHAENSATESDPPENDDGMCALCRNLNIETLVSDYSGEGRLYDLGALIDSASRCQMCARLFGLERLRRLDGAKFNNGVRVEFQIRPRVGGCCGVLQVETKHRSSPRLTEVKSIAYHTAFTNEGDIASSKYGILPLHTMGTNTSSAESFNVARKWLRNCIEGHQGDHNLRERSFRNRFGRSTSETGIGPARLIDVFAQERDAMSEVNWSKGSSGLDFGDLPGNEYPRGQKKTSRIVDRADVQGPYLALSYMWGTHPYKGYITTNANLLARERNIVEHELPKTFRDAIHVARNLGVRYLWIDAVCIIQDSENAKDWLQESGKMGSIFANALMTLFAAGAEHSEEGIFNKRSITFDEEVGPDPFALHTVLPGGAVRSTLHFVPSDPMYRSRPWSPLHSRAWCLQEDLLSTRKLYYKQDQLHWECDHLAVSEDDLSSPEFAQSPTASSSLSNMNESELARHTSCAWYIQVIEIAYSSRIATERTDRLIAVAGLASHVAKQIKSRYLAGLWEVSILQGLLWETETWNENTVKTYCAPSWSWASREAHTIWESIGKDHENFVPDCEYLGARIELLSSDLYGGVVSGTLTLRSNVVEVVVEEVGGEVSVSFEGIRGWVWLDEDTSLSGTSFLAVPVLDDVSLLVTKNLGRDTYRRIGIWRIQTKTRYGSIPGGTWDPAEHLRWKEEILPRIPVTEIEIE
jgi:hypothetical protein